MYSSLKAEGYFFKPFINGSLPSNLAPYSGLDPLQILFMNEAYTKPLFHSCLFAPAQLN